MLVGGGVNDEEGYFVEPTVIETKRSRFPAPQETSFSGRWVTAYVYPEGQWSDTLDLVDRTAPYGLTGAVFADDRQALVEARDALRYAAGNFYVNDKPTGAVVGQQPFGGARASGTNDKAGSMWNLIRWVSPRTIKETFVPATDYRYPFMQPDRTAAKALGEGPRRGGRRGARARRLVGCRPHRRVELRVGNLDAKRDFLDVRDVARAYALTIEHTHKLRSGVILNVASGNPCRIGDMLQTLLALSRVAITVEQDPARMRASDLPLIVGDAARARELLGWNSEYNLNDTLAAVLDDCRSRVARSTE